MTGKATGDARLAEVVADIQIPLDNLAYTIEAYLLANGARLDTETRFLLAGIRDCADRVAGSVRRMSGPAVQPAALLEAVADPVSPVRMRRRSPA